MRERWRFGWAIFFLIATVGVLASLTRYALRVQHLRTLRDAAATEHAQLKATHQALAVQLTATLPPQAAAATARAGMGMVAPNEQAVRVLPATPTFSAVADPPNEAAPPSSEKTPWQWWWQLFFGPAKP